MTGATRARECAVRLRRREMVDEKGHLPVNPFDDPDGRFYVVINAEGQHSLWPDIAAVPSGWTVVHGVTSRSSCIDYINANWKDMRPRSLVAYMNCQHSPEPESQA